jgi:anti-sigma B factor antagonist
VRPGDLQIRCRRDGERHVIELAGELTLANAQDLRETFAHSDADAGQELLVDLSEISFMDSTGLREILSIDRQCGEKDLKFYLCGARRPVKRLFELAGVLHRLPFLGEQ